MNSNLRSRTPTDVGLAYWLEGERRSGYSLLELLIAMGLLGTLMAVAWSLMGTYRDAEQRGWNLSQRTQTVRLIREMLERDLLQLIVDEYHPELDDPDKLASGMIDNDASNLFMTDAKSRDLSASFLGNQHGFTAVVHSSLDPLPFLDQFLGGGAREDAPFSNDGVGSALNLSSQPDQDLRMLWPPDRIIVEYRLKPVASPAIAFPTTSRSDEEAWMLVRTERASAQQFQAVQESSFGTSERTLTANDLYRTNDERSTLELHTLRESIVPGLGWARFFYWDGSQWKSSWNSSSSGRMPAAISISFDIRPDRTSISSQGKTAAEVESDSSFDLSMDAQSLSEIDLSEESVAENHSEAGQANPRDVRVVVRLWQVPGAESRGIR